MLILINEAYPCKCLIYKSGQWAWDVLSIKVANGHGTSFPCKSMVEGEVVLSGPTGCVIIFF